MNKDECVEGIKEEGMEFLELILQLTEASPRSPLLPIPYFLEYETHILMTRSRPEAAM